MTIKKIRAQGGALLFGRAGRRRERGLPASTGPRARARQPVSRRGRRGATPTGGRRRGKDAPRWSAQESQLLRTGHHVRYEREDEDDQSAGNGGGVELSVQVLTTGSWPIDKHAQFQVPLPETIQHEMHMIGRLSRSTLTTGSSSPDRPTWATARSGRAGSPTARSTTSS